MKKYFPKFFSTQTPRQLELEREYYARQRRLEEESFRHFEHMQEVRRRENEEMEQREREAFLKTTYSLYN